MSWFIPDGDESRQKEKGAIDAYAKKYLDREWLRQHLLYQGISRLYQDVRRYDNLEKYMEEYTAWVDEMINHLYGSEDVSKGE